MPPETQRLSLGRLLVTPGIMTAGLTPASLLGYLERHQSGDWGDLDDHDRAANRRALAADERVLSCYTRDGVRFYVITEAADGFGRRSATTILLPDEY